MTDVEATVQRYYGDRPVMQRIDDELRAAGVDPERPSHRDLWPFDQLYDVPFPRGLDAIPTLGRVQTVFGFRC